MAGIVKIELQGATKLKQALSNFPNIADPIYKQAIHDSSDHLLKMSQLATKAVLPQKTGALRSSFRSVIGKYFVLFFPDPTVAPYAIFVHEGTRAHEIRPKRARALSFSWIRGGKLQISGGGKVGYAKRENKGVVSFKRVWHPGTRAFPFMVNIAAQSDPLIRGTMSVAVSDVVAAIARQAR